ncbi:hypothetical protein SAMN05192574_101385 [Mucilaginibacter gossypiicola]|uniref:Uncharacterized protein n=1 Tax=Mucilaginibacter gossypiicola TaxID=551995 RepID=A0A1H8A6V1_9SPHI|nr:hypothetical protein [Mucilaginibacter gossypiicola]SEM66331.1 hypothetical protein SAMN05192574_101385 [Mucilaginibacter gossypiicola]
MELIRVQEMLAVMDLKGEDGLPIPCNFRFIDCNLKKGTGGKRITVKNVVIVGGVSSDSTQRNPNHFQNYTRNFRSIYNNEIRKFHPLLVEEFNNMRVVL